MKRFVCILAIVALFCASSNAAIQTVTANWAQSNASGQPITDTVQQFSGPGTLTSVMITLDSVKLTPVAQVICYGPGTFAFSNATCAYAANIVTVNGYGSSSAISEAITSTPAAAGNISGPFTILSFVSSTSTSGQQMTFTATGADLAKFIGNGTTNLGFTITDGGTYSGSKNGNDPVGFGGRADLAGSAIITYTYDVPEPATLAILGLGGLLLRRRIA